MVFYKLYGPSLMGVDVLITLISELRPTFKQHTIQKNDTGEVCKTGLNLCYFLVRKLNARRGLQKRTTN